MKALSEHQLIWPLHVNIVPQFSQIAFEPESRTVILGTASIPPASRPWLCLFSSQLSAVNTLARRG